MSDASFPTTGNTSIRVHERGDRSSLKARFNDSSDIRTISVYSVRTEVQSQASPRRLSKIRHCQSSGAIYIIGTIDYLGARWALLELSYVRRYTVMLIGHRTAILVARLGRAERKAIGVCERSSAGKINAIAGDNSREVPIGRRVPVTTRSMKNRTSLRASKSILEFWLEDKLEMRSWLRPDMKRIRESDSSAAK